MKSVLTFIFLISTTGTLFAQKSDLEASIEKGAKLYRKNCAVCHSKNGTGKGKRIPPLAQSDYLMSNITESIKAVKYGLKGKITVNGVIYEKEMKALDLSDKEIALIMNYVLNSWGNTTARTLTDKEVAAIKKD